MLRCDDTPASYAFRYSLRVPRRPKKRNDLPPPREEATTVTDPVELEAARIKSSLPSPPTSVNELQSPESAMLAAYEARFGGFDRVPVVAVPQEQLASQLLEGRVAMIVPLLDGRSTIRQILDIRLVNQLDALAALKELIERGIVRLG
jgi:hypothetical protein